jgi:hypothetical protein
MLSARFVAAAIFIGSVTATAGTALAQAAPSSSPSPVPSATPSAPSDPCGSLLSIVNRPTVTTGVCTVRTGHFDVENGYTNTTTAGPGGPSQISAEYAYFSSAGPNLGGKSLIDFVYQRDFGSHVQFDVEYGFSPTVINGQTSHYVGAGLSFMN